MQPTTLLNRASLAERSVAVDYIAAPEKIRNRTARRANAKLWIAQGLLAALFLFAGGMKLAAPIDALAQMMHFNGYFMKFIGSCEFLGALGLILPGVFRIRQGLTPIAASGLVIIMIGAVISSVILISVSSAIMPALVGTLAGYVAYGRRSLTLQRASVPRHAALDLAA